MRLRFLFPLLGFSSLAILAAACGTDGSTGDGSGGEGGSTASAGESSGGNAGSGDTSTVGGDTGAAGADTGAGGACSDSGTGTLVFEVSGLPDGVLPDVSTTGADELAVSEAGPIEAVPAGTYNVTAARVFDEDPRVRTVYDATIAQPSFCLGDGESHTIKVTYKAIPTSNKLWMPTDMDNELAGFASASLAATATKTATISTDAPGSKFIAFDQDGNLWALGPTVADAQVARFKAADFAASGKHTPDVAINVPSIECTPAVGHLAFDADGNLWLSGCAGVTRLAASDLASSGDKTPDVTIEGVTENEGIAFDKMGNLWVAGGAKLLRFDAARLGDNIADAADLSLTVTAALGNLGLKADELAFDKAGNLWAVDEGSNHIFQIAEAALSQMGDKPVKANVSFQVDSQALPFGPAFDDSNYLWVTMKSGTLGAFSPAQRARRTN